MGSTQEKCYRLPWTAEDNPNGWIEPTTFCQLNCPGCYRGVDKEGHKGSHLDIEELKSQVDRFIEERNIQTLSIAGGEPLMYPDLEGLIKYARGKGLRTMIYTNGIGLDEARLQALKLAGATQVLIHIDKFQNRTATNTLSEINALRGKYCELFRKVEGINLGFIQPLSKDCLNELPELTKFFTHNRDMISLVVFTLYREICWDHIMKPVIDTSITTDEVLDSLEREGVFRRAAYLPATLSAEDPSWVFSYSLGSGSRILGFLDKKVYSRIQAKYYQRKHKHLFISRSYQVKLSGLLKLIFFRSIFRIFVRYITYPVNRLYFQTYLVIRGPVKKDREWDLCQGCPDAMYYNGKLEPSCILEEIRAKKLHQQTY